MNKERTPILIVEDDNGIMEVLKTIAGIHKLPAYFATTGAEALDILEHHKVALVVCDFMLPDINGDSILRNVRKNESTKELPFIFLSAFANPEDIQKGLQAGANAYITKPFSVNGLMNVITSHLS